MRAPSVSRPAWGRTYPPAIAARVPDDRAAVLCESLVREALRVVRDAGTAKCLRASQNYTDCMKGRPVGARSIGRMLADAKRAGVPLQAALGVAGAVEAFTLSLYIDESVGVAASLHAETAAEGEANGAQMRLALSGDDASLQLALQESIAHLTAQRRLVAALARELARRGR